MRYVNICVFKCINIMDVNYICLHGTCHEVRYVSYSVHHTCNMRTCSGISIAYAQGHRIMLGVCAWVWSPIIIVDEWVVSSYFGQRSIDISRLMCVGRSKKGTVNPLR